MYTIKIEASFSAAHNLRGYKGKCEELHGHNWKVEVAATAEKLDKIGMVLDFKYLKEKVNKILDVLDHKYLNEIPYFSAAGGSSSGGKKINPTSENIAKYIYDRVSASGVRLPDGQGSALGGKGQGSNVKSVTVWESENSCAVYEE